MTLNFPGPFEVRLFYTTIGRTHVAKYNVDIVTPYPALPFTFADVNVRLSGGGTATLAARVLAWVSALRGEFNSGDATIDYAELWEMVPQSFDGSFLATESYSLAGTSGAGTIQASQNIYVFRTAEGNPLKINLMEVTQGDGVPKSYSDLSANQQGIVDMILGANNPFLGRDTAYPVAFSNMFPGKNEALYKKIYRP